MSLVKRETVLFLCQNTAKQKKVHYIACWYTTAHLLLYYAESSEVEGMKDT